MTTLLAEVPSSSSNATYKIQLGDDNNVYCSCPAWKFQKLPPKARTCKHINALSLQMKQLASKLGAVSPASVVVAVPKAAPAKVAAPVAAPVAVAAKVAAAPAPVAPVVSTESKKAALAAKKAALAAEEAALLAEEQAAEKAAAKAALVAEVASLKKALALAEAKLSVA